MMSPVTGLKAIPVGASNRDESLTVDRDVEVPAGIADRAGGKIRAGVGGDRVDPRRIPRAVDWKTLKFVGVGAESYGADVRHIVRIDGLRLHDLLCAGHRHI